MKLNHNNIQGSLQKKREGLIKRFSEIDPTAFLTQHTRMIDEYFQQSFEASMVGPRIGIDKNPYTFIALGGYGREEQCVHSDIDLLFLFKNTIPDAADNLIQEIIYPLWDIGLKVGYAARSFKECLQLAAKDYEVLTPLLDARFICGISALYSELMQQPSTQDFVPMILPFLWIWLLIFKNVLSASSSCSLCNNPEPVSISWRGVPKWRKVHSSSLCTKNGTLDMESKMVARKDSESLDPLA